MIITHAKVSLLSDGPDTDLIRPSDWNLPHVINPPLSVHTHVIGELPTKLSSTNFQTLYAYTASTLAVYRNGIRERYFTEISDTIFQMTTPVKVLDEILLDYIKKEV